MKVKALQWRWGLLENLGRYHRLPHQDEQHRRGRGCVSREGSDARARAVR
jgi:hypothetical protein